MPNIILFMQKNNPLLIPRNHKVEEVLELALKLSDYSALHQFVKRLRNPFENNWDQDEYTQLPVVKNTTYKTFCGT